MSKRILVALAVALVAAVALSATGAFGKGGGRLELYLVNSGPNTRFFDDSTAADGNCDPVLAKAASLSTSKGTSRQQDNPDGSSANPARASVFSYTVPAGGSFTIPSNENSVMLKIWTFSGDGTCPDQNLDQFFLWSVDCAGPTCGSVSLSGGEQQLNVPAGTPINTLFNVHVGVSSPVNVGAGDTITLRLRSPLYYLPIQWSAPNGPGVSSLSILTG